MNKVNICHYNRYNKGRAAIAVREIIKSIPKLYHKQELQHCLFSSGNNDIPNINTKK